MNRRIFAIVLTLALLLGLFPMEALAEEVTENTADSEAQTEEASPPKEEEESETALNLQATGTVYTSGNYSYTVTNETATITAYSGSESNVTIPATLGGYSVVGIGSSAFYNHDSLVGVAFPDSVTSIGNHAFYGCDSLIEVDFPDNLESIEYDAFYSCKNLKNIQLPKSLQSLGSGAFYDCDSIASIEIPKSLESASSPFQNCDGLKSVSFESGITTIVPYLFEGCDGLEKITIPNSVTSIGNYAFYDCDSLIEVNLLDNVASIGSYAFYHCDNLIMIHIPKSVTTISSTAFSNSPNVVFYCDYHSYAALYAIENNIPFKANGKFVDSENYMINYGSSNYYADMNGMSANGYVTMTLNYAVKDAWKERVSDRKVKLLLPSSAALDESTLKVDGVLCTNYSYDDRTLLIPVSNNRGTVKFSVKMTGQGDFLSYAAFQAKKDGVATSEVVGILNESVKLLTLNVPDVTAEKTLQVSGVAPASAVVTLSIDGTQQTTATASKAGIWSAELTLPAPEDYHSYTIQAQCPDGSGTLEKQTKVTYIEGEPSVTGITMYYGSNHCELVGQGEVKPIVYFVPGVQFDFEARVENPEQIDHFYITSTRNNEKKYLEATYDAEKGVFVTDGYFDEQDKRYVPGVISYEYTKKIEPVYVSDQYDLTAVAKEVAISNQAVTVHENTEKSLQATVDFSKLEENLVKAGVNVAVEVYDAATDGNLSEWKGLIGEVDTVLSYTVDGYDGEKYLCELDYSDPATYVMIISDATNSQIIKLILDNQMDLAEGTSAYSTLWDVSSALGTIGTVSSTAYKLLKIDRNMDDLREEVMSGAYSSEVGLDATLKKVDALESDQKMFTLMMVALPLVATVAGGVGIMTGPTILFSAMLGMMSATSSFFWDARIGDIKGEGFYFKACPDPSGYVYDAETGERLEDVTVTAYCIESDDSEGFWDTKPDSETEGTLWNAIEYNQANPLLTNTDGKYAWDVPEGWWRVKYEKEGYATAWSDWVPVPPPQTEMNMGLLALVTGDYTFSLLDETETEATVSLTNHTALPKNVTYILAAYEESGKLVAVNTVSQGILSEGSLSLTVACPETAAYLKAFVLDSATNTPLRAAWTKQLSM